MIGEVFAEAANRNGISQPFVQTMGGRPFSSAHQEDQGATSLARESLQFGHEEMRDASPAVGVVHDHIVYDHERVAAAHGIRADHAVPGPDEIVTGSLGHEDDGGQIAFQSAP